MVSYMKLSEAAQYNQSKHFGKHSDKIVILITKSPIKSSA